MLVTGTGTDAITDYIAIAIVESKPVVYLNYGTGHVQLSINRNVNDGVWHKLELNNVERVSVVFISTGCEISHAVTIYKCR